MGSYNNISAEVISRLGNRSDISSRVSTWINDAYFELLLNPTYSFFELDSLGTFNTVAGTLSYDLTSFLNFWFILDISDHTNSRKLERTHWQVLDAVIPTTGQPYRYYRFGNSIILDPIPDGVYSIQVRYRSRPAELTPSSSTLTPREWDEVITVLAVAKGWEALLVPDRAAATRQLLAQLLATRQDVPMLEDMDSTTTLEPVLLYRR